ncbi:hypothetical protein V2A60_008220 [Cordyceps javanica]
MPSNRIAKQRSRPNQKVDRGTSSDAYARVLREKDRLDKERASAEEDLEPEIVARGVESLDELEAQERSELEACMANQSPEFLMDLGLPVSSEFLLPSGGIATTGPGSS